MKNTYVECLKKESIIKVEGREGSYSVIDDYHGYVMLEHNTYGEEDILVAKASDFIWKEYTNRKTGEKVNRPFFRQVDTYSTYDDIETTLYDWNLI